MPVHYVEQLLDREPEVAYLYQFGNRRCHELRTEMRD